MTAKVSLRTARTSRGLSVEQLRQLTGLAAGTIYTIEGHYTDYSVKHDTAQLLADALSYNVNDIDWPNGLSDLGRNPHTGGNVIRRQNSKVDPKFCTKCFTQLPDAAESECAWC